MYFRELLFVSWYMDYFIYLQGTKTMLFWFAGIRGRESAFRALAQLYLLEH